MSSQPNESLPQAIARRLAAARERSGISQGELSRRAQVSSAYITQLEAGERTPSVPVLLRLADAVECRPCELLRDNEPVSV